MSFLFFVNIVALLFSFFVVGVLLGVAVLGRSSKNISDAFCKEVFKDNPLGQSAEQTPLCIVRKADN